jgi:hypothetical protein
MIFLEDCPMDEKKAHLSLPSDITRYEARYEAALAEDEPHLLLTPDELAELEAHLPRSRRTDQTPVH